MEKSRDQIIIKTSIIGILTNVLLASFKAVVGLLSSSIAIVLDAVNNLSDALSSLITIIGTKLSKKEPDKKHPLGYGRIEYLSATLISMIIIYAGISAFIESFKNILNPSTPNYSYVSLIIVAVAVLVKIILGTYVRKTGEKINSDSLVASGKDALFDSIISSSTLVAAIIYLLTKISLEAYLGLIISILIIKAGFEMLLDTISEILGERVDSDLAKTVKETIKTFPEVLGVYDLVIHNYGPEKLLGSAHIEISDKLSVNDLDVLERKITNKVLKDTNVVITGISIYVNNTNDEKAVSIFNKIKEITSEYEDILEVHGFFMKDNNINFDIIIDLNCKNRQTIYEEVNQKVKELYPQYNISIILDTDISD